MAVIQQRCRQPDIAAAALFRRIFPSDVVAEGKVAQLIRIGGRRRQTICESMHGGRDVEPDRLDVLAIAPAVASEVPCSTFRSAGECVREIDGNNNAGQNR